MIRRLLLALTLSLGAVAAAHAQGMLDTKHNLSAYGPSSRTVKAQTETQICVFCHTPHNTTPTKPLWNRDLSYQNGVTYNAYASNTLQATVGQPNGYSKLCLSCHDGSLAIGSVMNLGGQSRTITMLGTEANGAFPTNSSAFIATNLTNDHPISFAFTSTVYTNDKELVDPTTAITSGTGVISGVIKLYEGATAGVRDSVQCTTCHDPHSIVNPCFLKKSFTGQTDNLCLTCHIKPGWDTSSHRNASTSFSQTLCNATSTVPVSQLSCGACHRPHVEQGAVRLLRGSVPGGSINAPAIEQTCYRCHTTGGITWDLKKQFDKVSLSTGSAHRIYDAADPPSASHEPVFTTVLDEARQEPVANNKSKHVECPDCHNPHRVRARSSTGINGVYTGMRGIAQGGTIVDGTKAAPDDVHQWEICFRCHGDTFSTAVGTSVDGDQNGTRAVGKITTSNKRVEFNTSNSAFHPVGGAGRNTSPNLNAQFAWISPNKPSSTSDTILCTDCHNNDTYVQPTYKGAVSQYTSTIQEPMGPHGSANFNLLRARQWNVLPGPSSYNSQNFALCFQCHDPNRLTGGATINRPRDISSGARTNFDDEAGGLTNSKGKGNLHYLHLNDKVGSSAPICKDCHYNVHSNQQASNTRYRITTSADPNCTGGTASTTPPSGTPTHLVNFNPETDSGGQKRIKPLSGRTLPEWCFFTDTKERKCYLQCHNSDGTANGFVMDGFSYKPSCGDEGGTAC